MNQCCINNSNQFKNIDCSIDILKAISEPNRIRILCILSKKEICVCELAQEIGISRNLLSFHLKTLFEVGILAKEKISNKIFFYIKDEWKGKVKNLFIFLALN